MTAQIQPGPYFAFSFRRSEVTGESKWRPMARDSLDERRRAKWPKAEGDESSRKTKRISEAESMKMNGMYLDP